MPATLPEQGLLARGAEFLDRFLSRFESRRPAFYKVVERALADEPALFRELAETMLPWAALQFGDDFEDALIEGYCAFTIDVNRSQLTYERTRHYLKSSYKEVYDTAYNDSEFMRLYHWGVFTTTFAWPHHLRIYRLFRDSFLSRLGEKAERGCLLDLGAGSGVWHLLATRILPQWQVEAVDISETSIQISRAMGQKIAPRARLSYHCADALEHQLSAPADAGISCFLLEHLETPDRLLLNLSRNLKPRAYAFVTLALTAAEYDHIFEFQRESEPIRMAEDAGFRVVEMLSSAPESARPTAHFLPRSMAMVLQKRQGPIW